MSCELNRFQTLFSLYLLCLLKYIQGKIITCTRWHFSFSTLWISSPKIMMISCQINQKTFINIPSKFLMLHNGLWCFSRKCCELNRLQTFLSLLVVLWNLCGKIIYFINSVDFLSKFRNVILPDKPNNINKYPIRILTIVHWLGLFFQDVLWDK